MHPNNYLSLVNWIDCTAIHITLKALGLYKDLNIFLCKRDINVFSCYFSLHKK